MKKPNPNPKRSRKIRALHREQHGCDPACVAVVPGRLVLLGNGEYVDDGLSLACAIGKYTWVSASHRADRRLVIHSEWAGQTIHISPRAPNPAGHGFWADYVVGVWGYLAGKSSPQQGVSLTIAGNLPPGIGLGSSASLQMGVSLVLRSLWDLRMDDRDLALCAHRSENYFVGVRTGLVDHLVVIEAKQDRILHLDCSTLDSEQIDMPCDCKYVVCDSGLHRALARAPFNKRRKELDEALVFYRNQYPGLTGFRQVNAEMLVRSAQDLSPVALKRARHVVTENDRVRRAAIAIRWGDFETLGGLMLSSYRSSKDAFETSTTELDEIIRIGRRNKGLLGAGICGPGFGGCTMHLIKEDQSSALIRDIKRNYKTPGNRPPRIYSFTPVSGASVAILKH